MGIFTRRVVKLSQTLRIMCLICVTGGSQDAMRPLFLPFLEVLPLPVLMIPEFTTIPIKMLAKIINSQINLHLCVKL